MVGNAPIDNKGTYSNFVDLEDLPVQAQSLEVLDGDDNEVTARPPVLGRGRRRLVLTKMRRPPVRRHWFSLELSRRDVTRWCK